MKIYLFVIIYGLIAYGILKHYSKFLDSLSQSTWILIGLGAGLIVVVLSVITELILEN